MPFLIRSKGRHETGYGVQFWREHVDRFVKAFGFNAVFVYVEAAEAKAYGKIVSSLGPEYKIVTRPENLSLG